MKTRIQLMLMAATLLAAAGAHASLYTENFNDVNTAIPAGNPVGITFSGPVSDIPVGNTVGGLTITLNLSGGYNGSLYAYLVAPSGTRVTLFDQPGVTAQNPFGYAGSGFNVTLADAYSPNDIQTASETTGVPLTGNYSAYGTLADFNSSAANGTWNLYFADMANGGGTSTLNSWSLGIDAVPEPVSEALAIFGAMMLVIVFLRRLRAWNKLSGRNSAFE